MPHVTQERRAIFDAEIRSLIQLLTLHDFLPGDLNYVISRLCWAAAERGSEMGYSRLNSVIGVLECAKLEMYRRVVSPYEDDKLLENGDIETCEA